jgi:hypothetical protein
VGHLWFIEKQAYLNWYMRHEVLLVFGMGSALIASAFVVGDIDISSMVHVEHDVT